MTPAQALEPQQGRISLTASSTGAAFHCASTPLMCGSHPRSASREIPPPDSPPPPTDILRSIECRRSAESLRPPLSSPASKVMSQSAFPSPVVLFPSTESGPGQHSPARCEHLLLPRWYTAPAPQCTLSKWPARCALQPCECKQDVSKIDAPDKSFEPV